MVIDAAAVAIIGHWLPYIFGLLATLTIALFLFAYQLMRYGPAIRKLNRFETISKLAYFADRQEDAALAFGNAAASSDLVRQAAEQIKGDLDNLRDAIADMQERLSGYNADAITKNRLQDEAQASDSSRAPELSGADVDVMYPSIVNAWEKFLEAFRTRLLAANIQPNMKRIGRMTYDLMDRRRRNPIPPETGELIAALHSQYKRYERMRGTRNEWLTKEAHDNFVQLVNTAIAELQRQS